MPWSESKYTYICMYVLLEPTVALTILSEGEFTASSNSDAGKKDNNFAKFFSTKQKIK